MRIIAEIPHPSCKISVFYMNQKYIIKIEKGNFELGYKISELDYAITGLDDIKKVINDNFVTSALAHFNKMQEDLNTALIDY